MKISFAAILTAASWSSTAVIVSAFSSVGIRRSSSSLRVSTADTTTTTTPSSSSSSAEPTNINGSAAAAEETSSSSTSNNGNTVRRKEDSEVFRKHERPKSFATKCASLYHPNVRGAGRGLAPPVHFGSTFVLDDAAHGARLHEKMEQPYTDDDGFVYSRWGSPTNEAAALQIAALEGVDDPSHPSGKLGKCLLFNSGMSAITSSLMSVLQAGDHIVLPFTVYGGTHEFVETFCTSWGIDVSYVDSSGTNGPFKYKDAFRPNTKVVYAETPANPTMRLTDLRGLASVVDEYYGSCSDSDDDKEEQRTRPWVMVDGTFATPYHQRVLDVPGVDVSIHSATKYLGGHSDLLAGSVTSRSESFLHKCSKVQKLITVPLNPMDSFLLTRGLRTLDVRMQRHGETAMKLAKMLESHPAVAQVFYPGLDSHPDRRMADDLFLSGRDEEDENEDDIDDTQTYGGMVTFIMDGKDDVALQRARNVCEHLRVVNLAVSLGGVESLVEHPASMTHAMIPREQRLAGGLHDGLIRLSVGLEKASDLLRDLRTALDRCDEDGCDIDMDVM